MTSSRALLILPALLFLPLAAHGQAVTGWRNDGSGKYPDATPPTTWGRVSRPTKSLRYMASRPGDADAGSQLPVLGLTSTRRETREGEAE